MGDTRTMTGGCQCGRIRYTAQVDPEAAYLCHCGMCKKATGGFAASFVNLPRGDVEWLGEPDWYRSSPIARRPFCSACGTPLGFRYDEGDSIDLTIGSFDDPAGFVPSDHSGAENLDEAWIDTRALPRLRTQDSAAIAARWAKAEGSATG